MGTRLLDPPGPRSDLRPPSELHRAGGSSAFVDAIWKWWPVARAQRDELPWRQSRDPWEVLVSELMLTQTQAARVAGPYLRFLERFPTVTSCAEAAEGDVIRAWSGLGYNSRALRLHRCSSIIVDRYRGEVPATLPELLGLPGVGPYVARAVLAFAFGRDVGVLDTNIGRVLARAVAGQKLTPTAAQQLADSIVPAGMGREWNLALMDFGNVTCRSRAPLCGGCPITLSGHCRWRAGDGGDPAAGSASVSRPQASFRGSDRQVRGRLVAAACGAVIGPDEAAAVAGLVGDPERARRIADDLVNEGLLIVQADGSLSLP